MDYELIELLARVGTRTTPKVLPVAYVTSQAAASAPAVINAGALLYETGNVEGVIVSDADPCIGMNPALPGQPANGYEGGEFTQKRLIEERVKPAAIMMMPGARVDGSIHPSKFNTLTEMTALVRFMSKHRISDVLVVAPDFHLPRVMVSMVTAMYELQATTLRVWGHSVAVDEWKGNLVHSQGVTGGTIREIFAGECTKIAGPKRFDNLVPLHRVLSYLDWRDFHFS